MRAYEPHRKWQNIRSPLVPISITAAHRSATSRYTLYSRSLDIMARSNPISAPLSDADREDTRGSVFRRPGESVYVGARSQISVNFFTARCYASAVLAIGLCLSVYPSQVGVLLKRVNESSWFSAYELPSTRPTLC